MPRECHVPDFKGMDLWRSFNCHVLKDIHEVNGGTVIVPMTLVDPAYYRELVQRLIDKGVP